MHGVYLSPESPVPPSGPPCVALTESSPWGPSPEGLRTLEAEVGQVPWALVAICTFITILRRLLPSRCKEQGWGTHRPPAAGTAKWLGEQASRAGTGRGPRRAGVETLLLPPPGLCVQTSSSPASGRNKNSCSPETTSLSSPPFPPLPHPGPLSIQHPWGSLSPDCLLGTQVHVRYVEEYTYSYFSPN